jgi:hypothetical protein
MADRFAGLGPSDIARVVITENSEGPRFIVIPTSLAGHGCCFGWSVVDRENLGDSDRLPEPLCECLTEEAANRIAAALNESGGGA